MRALWPTYAVTPLETDLEMSPMSFQPSYQDGCECSPCAALYVCCPAIPKTRSPSAATPQQDTGMSQDHRTVWVAVLQQGRVQLILTVISFKF